MFSNARFNKLFLSVAVAFSIAQIVPPASISLKGWYLFAVFVGTILAVILDALPMGAASLMGLTIAITTGSLSFEQAFSGYSNEIVWLVVIAFFIANGITHSGLGKRIAYTFVRLLGKKTLGLAYGITLSETLLAPAIPSVTARSGGITFPIILSLSESFGSFPHGGTSRRLGSYLTLVGYQASVISSAMFLTGMAGNPLAAKLATELGVPLSWGTWALGALLPGLFCLVLVPWLLFKLYPPEITETPHAVEMAKQKLAELGPLERNEKIMLFTLVLLLTLWVFGSVLHLSATTAALIGLGILLLFHVLNWGDLVKLGGAFDTLIWFGALIALADGLKSYGLPHWYGKWAASLLGDIQWTWAVAILFLLYFFTHYFFASATAQIGALFVPFVAVCLELGAPALPVILLFSHGSNLMGTLTHYGLSSAPLLFGSGYVPLKVWWRVGFIMALTYIVIWAGIGSLWWKLLGFV